MSNSDSNKKQLNKKSNNSYSLLLKGLSEVQKSKPTNKNPRSSIKSKDKLSQSAESLESTMSSQNNDYPENTSSNAKDVQDPDVPDRSYGDYFCKLCDSHMNSDNMWDAHITGKRHIKNVKKGDTESKYDDLPDVESTIKYELRNVKDPIVGLSYIHEIRRKEPNIPPIYNCFLCHASIATVPLVTEHVISMKHRLNYIKENNPEEYQLIEATNLKKGHMEPLVLEAARKMEQQDGRGTVKVKQEKKKAPVTTWGTNSYKRSFNQDEDMFDNRYEKPYSKNPNFEELGSRSDVWKSVDIGRGFGRRERSKSPRNFRDDFMMLSRSRSPSDFRERKRMHSGDDHSMDGYKRSFSKRDRSLSPPQRDNYERHGSYSKRDISPEDDYHSFRSNTDDYLQPSRKSDTHDRNLSFISRGTLSSVPSRYEPTPPREATGVSYSSLKHQKTDSSFLPEKNYLQPRERSHDNPPVATQKKTFESVFEDTLLLSPEECYKLFYLRLKSLPQIGQISEILILTKLISEAQKKLKSTLCEEFISALANYPKLGHTSATNIIPGLGDAMSLSAKPHDIRTDNSQKASNTASFLNEILKSVQFSSKMPTTQDKTSFPFPLPTSFASAINSQPAALGNAFQTSPPSYQAPPAAANAYQGASTNSYPNQGASTNSYPNQGTSTNYPNQGPYQNPNGNTFLTGSIPNIPGLNLTGKGTPQSQVFNYSHFSSTSTPPSSTNYPHKY